MLNTYFIGGSPCSGKSTITEILSKKYDLYYFKVDDFLDKYTQMGEAKGFKICTQQRQLSTEQIWMRDPVLLCDDALHFFEEIFSFVIDDLKRISNKDGIITEGAAYLPKLMKGLNIQKDRYISITPSKDFQISHYKKREWVPYALEGCRDKEKAFANWMERDNLFAQDIQRQCDKVDYISVINDGSKEVDELLKKVVAHFKLDDR